MSDWETRRDIEITKRDATLSGAATGAYFASLLGAGLTREEAVALTEAWIAAHFGSPAEVLHVDYPHNLPPAPRRARRSPPPVMGTVASAPSPEQEET